jgi:hypothetical protein
MHSGFRAKVATLRIPYREGPERVNPESLQPLHHARNATLFVAFLPRELLKYDHYPLEREMTQP